MESGESAGVSHGIRAAVVGTSIVLGALVRTDKAQKLFLLKSKGKGNSGGARVITFNILTNVEKGQVVFLLLYDKEDASTVKVDVVKQLVQDMGFEI